MKMRLPLKSELDSIDKVNVPSAALHISGKLTGFQRKAWMCFFAVARNNPDEITHSCRVQDLVSKSGYASTNLKRLREDLKPLTVTPVSWDIFNKEETVRMGDSQMIADIEFLPGKGIIEWSFSPKLKRLLLTELKMYLQVNFSFLPELRGHEVAIYLNINDYINKKTNFGQKYLTVDQAKDMLGLKENEYAHPGDLFRILKRNIANINKKSDIDVFIEDKRGTRKKITGFMFSGRVKDEYIGFYSSKSISSKKFEEDPSKRSVLHLLSAEVKEKLNNWGFVFYQDVLQSLEKLAEIPYGFKKSEINRYLFFLITKVEQQNEKNKLQGINGNPGGLLKKFIVTDQHLDGFILKVKQDNRKEEKQRLRRQAAEKEQQDKFIEELKRIHTSKNLDAFIDYLRNDLDKFAPQLETLVAENKSLQFILKGRLLAEVLRDNELSPSIKASFLNYQDEFGFKPEPFEVEMYLNNPEFQELKNKYMVGASNVPA